MPTLQMLRDKVFGAPRDPMKPETRQHIALIAFFAWVGLGADGLSSSCYGPEEAFLALGQHTHLALYLAIATALTVFVISFAYNQVIELFPSGGGGYKVATKLIGPYAGLVSGAALIVDYVLTIAISVASGADALFSLLPMGAQPFKLATGLVFVLVLVILNLRGLKESIKFLLPIFLGFVVIHLVLIVYGIMFHSGRLPTLLHDTTTETFTLSAQMGWAFIISHLLLAYSTGGGTYTGLEAVSNNVNTLAEPRARTGKWTMFYLAVSLAFTASGIIMLYLLWNVHHVPGETLNAVVFRDILHSWTLGGVDWARVAAAGGPGIGGGAVVCRGQHRLSRWPGGARQHGGGSLGAPPVQLSVEPPGYAQWGDADGCGGNRRIAVDPRQRHAAGGAVWHQCVPDFFSVDGWHVHLLVAQSRGGTEMAMAPGSIRHRAVGHRRDTGGVDCRKIRAGRLDDSAHHQHGDWRLPAGAPPL